MTNANAIEYITQGAPVRTLLHTPHIVAKIARKINLKLSHSQHYVVQLQG